MKVLEKQRILQRRHRLRLAALKVTSQGEEKKEVSYKLIPPSKKNASVFSNEPKQKDKKRKHACLCCSASVHASAEPCCFSEALCGIYISFEVHLAVRRTERNPPRTQGLSVVRLTTIPFPQAFVTTTSVIMEKDWLFRTRGHLHS